MKILIQKQLNLFLFIVNLTEWHFSVTKSFNKKWKKLPKPLSLEEKRVLLDLTKILKSYQQKYQEHLIIEFLGENRINWNKLSQKLLPENIKTLKYALKIFESRFEYFYCRQYSNMEKLKKSLLSFFAKSKSWLEKIQNFYNWVSKKEILIYLTLSSEANKQAGGIFFENSKKAYVILQFGDFNLKQEKWPLIDVLLHEISHLYQGSLMWENLIKKPTQKIIVLQDFKNEGITQKDVMNELIHCTLFSEVGTISQKIFNWSNQEILKKVDKLKSQKIFYHQAVLITSYSLRNEVQKYINSKEKIDKGLIELAVEQWNRVIKKIKI